METVAAAPAEQPATPSEPATPPVEAPAAPPSEEVSAAPEEQAVAEVAPPVEELPPPEVTGTEVGGGWIATLNSILGAVIPRSLLDSVPGGALTLLGALVAALAAIIALLTRRRAEPAPESVPTIAFEEEAYDEALSPVPAPEVAAAVAPAAAADEDLFAEISAEQRSVTLPITEAKRAEAAAEDPLAEVNVYLAYERFDEAERLIKEAIANYPNEHKYKLRLLEVYYSSNNRPGYEAAARELHDAVGGSGPLWDSAVAMWREMSPNRALFAGGEEPATQLSVPAGARQIVDITAMEEKTGRTVTSAVASMPTAEAGVDIPLTETAAEATGGGLDFDLDTGGSEGLIDISGSAESDIGDSLFDISVGGPAEADSLLEISVPSMIEGASPAVNELLSLTKSGAVQTADSDLAALMQSSLELGEADVTSSLTDDMNLAESTANPEDMLDFDLGGGFAGTQTKPEDSNVVEFPSKQDAMASASKPSVDTLSTMIDVAPLPEAKPDEFDIGELDLALTSEPATRDAAAAEQSLDLSLDSGGSAEVTVGDIDSMGLDEDTVRLFENDLAATSGQEAMPPFRPDNGAAVTSDDLLFNEQTLSKSIPGLALEQDDISLDDITKSLEETVGAKHDKDDFDTVDLSLDSGNMSEIEETAELFKDDLRPAPGAEETLGAPQSPFAEGQIGGDDVDTKLNLAKAYVELGDAAGARTILDEVANEGSEMQREEARRLLRELTT
jgi:pilus assembly protein FimV